ncbi:MAG: NAD(P)/FAD-dependent oxidoreductase [Eubacteriales bacterium]|nr:NAD(P)/FAD-dependent oxidoreductase [Eubacteriales bacterium]
MYDAIIVGAGVVGCAIAARLVQYSSNILVLEAADDVSEGASKANSGIVHAGYDAEPDTEKARLNVKGAKMMEDLCLKLGVPFGRPGALVLGFDEEDRKQIEVLYERSIKNGVDGCEIIEREQILKLEPNINPDVLCALNVPKSAIVSPYELTYALADSAKENGAEFLLNTKAETFEHKGDFWQVHTNAGTYEAKAIINCAGCDADRLHNQISTRQVEIIPRRGQYYLLDRMDEPVFSRTVFQVPTVLGKGVLISPTTHGNTLIGPNAEDIECALDTATTREGLDEVLGKSAKSWPKKNLRNVITTFSGVRAHEKDGDFIIGAVEGAPEGAFEAIGIESPGLSASPAIGEEMGDWVAYYLKLKKRGNYRPPTPLPKPFSRMSLKEREEAYRQDPLYGNLVCRCETVTEAEIRFSIRRPVGATSVDGVKRRTRAGMGRCQGGFCCLRVAEILKEELGESDLLHITKQGAGSEMLVGRLGEEDQA